MHTHYCPYHHYTGNWTLYLLLKGLHLVMEGMAPPRAGREVRGASRWAAGFLWRGRSHSDDIWSSMVQYRTFNSVPALKRLLFFQHYL